MRHRIDKKKLSRDPEHRLSLAKNLASSVIQHEKIETTLPKAKFAQRYVEKLITRAKEFSSDDKIVRFNTLKALQSKLYDKEIVRKLVDDVAPRFSSRHGGYTRVTKTRIRRGDNSVMARLELVETKPVAKTPAKEKTKRVVKEKKEKAANDK